MAEKLRLLSLGTLGIFAFFSAQPASAGNAACVWNKLNEATKTAALNAGLDGGPIALSENIDPSEMEKAETACGLTLANEGAFHRAQAGFMLQLLAEQWLSLHTTLSPKRLSDAWLKMTRSDKSVVVRWASSLKPVSQGYDRAYFGFIKSLGIPEQALPSDAKPKIITYLQGRALRTAFESKY